MTEVAHATPEMLNGPSPEQQAVTQLSDLITKRFDGLGLHKTKDGSDKAEDIMYPPYTSAYDMGGRIGLSNDRMASFDVRTLQEGTQPGTLMRKVHLEPAPKGRRGQTGTSLTEYTSPEGNRSYVFMLHGLPGFSDDGHRETYIETYSWNEGGDKISLIRTPDVIDYTSPDRAKKFNEKPAEMGITNQTLTGLDIDDVEKEVKRFLNKIPGNPDSPRRIVDDYRGQSKEIGKALLNMVPGVRVK